MGSEQLPVKSIAYKVYTCKRNGRGELCARRSDMRTTGAHAHCCTCSPQSHNEEAGTGSPNMSSSRDSLKHLDDAGSPETQHGPPHKRSIIWFFPSTSFQLPPSCVAPSPRTALLGR